jgi:hypothetical protein
VRDGDERAAVDDDAVEGDLRGRGAIESIDGSMDDVRVSARRSDPYPDPVSDTDTDTAREGGNVERSTSGEKNKIFDRHSSDAAGGCLRWVNG